MCVCGGIEVLFVAVVVWSYQVNDALPFPPVNSVAI